MKGRKTWQRGYAAGLMDGEGCIQIKKVKHPNGSRNAEYSLQININMTDGGSIDFMYGTFGGWVYVSQQYGLGSLPVYRWEIRREKAKKFLKEILPFLKGKKEQAELGIRFQENRETQQRKNGRYQPSPQYLLDRYETFYLKMKELKKVHIPSAAVTTNQATPQVEASDSLNLQEAKL